MSSKMDDDQAGVLYPVWSVDLLLAGQGISTNRTAVPLLEPRQDAGVMEKVLARESNAFVFCTKLVLAHRTIRQTFCHCIVVVFCLSVILITLFFFFLKTK